MKIKINDYKQHGNILEFDKVESINEVGVNRAHSAASDRGVVISLDLDYSIERGISYLQYINRNDYSSIEIH